MRDPFDPPAHHAPGIPCGAIGAGHRRALAFWYSEEPDGITCKHRACRAARFRLLAARLRTVEAPALAALEACG